jgi:hypothetical protein
MAQMATLSARKQAVFKIPPGSSGARVAGWPGWHSVTISNSVIAAASTAVQAAAIPSGMAI